MKTLIIRCIFLISFFGLFFTDLSWSQQAFYEVTSGQGNGVKFWGNNGSDAYKIHMGHNVNRYQYGPVTSYSIKTNMSDHTARGWTWGIKEKKPVVAINTEGKLQTESWIKSMARTFYLGNHQKLYGNNNVVFYLTSNNSTATRLVMRDKEDNGYGSLYGNSDGANFGLLDGDGHWSYKAVKDGHTAFFVNNSEKMRINNDGKVGIGSNIDYSPVGYRLYVQDGVIAEKVKVALEATNDWADYVFDDSYQLMSINDVEQFIKTHNHLPNVPSAQELVDTGIDVAKMDAKLLEKIEELTLYMIELDSQVQKLKEENENLKKIITQIK